MRRGPSEACVAVLDARDVTALFGAANSLDLVIVRVGAGESANHVADSALRLARTIGRAVFAIGANACALATDRGLVSNSRAAGRTANRAPLALRLPAFSLGFARARDEERWLAAAGVDAILLGGSGATPLRLTGRASSVTPRRDLAGPQPPGVRWFAISLDPAPTALPLGDTALPLGDVALPLGDAAASPLRLDPGPYRFALLRHERPGHPDAHFDLLLERPAGHCWAFELSRVDAGASARSTFDHRIEYLTVEGPISGGRGWVWQIDSGTFRLERDASRACADWLASFVSYGPLRRLRFALPRPLFGWSTGELLA